MGRVLKRSGLSLCVLIVALWTISIFYPFFGYYGADYDNYGYQAPLRLWFG